jgi:hypothetical protein
MRRWQALFTVKTFPGALNGVSFSQGCALYFIPDPYHTGA